MTAHEWAAGLIPLAGLVWIGVLVLIARLMPKADDGR